MSLAHRQYNELRMTYIEQMTALGLPIPYTVEAFGMYEVLNQPLSDLLQQMHKNPALLKAMQDTLSRWEEFLREIRRDQSTKE